MLPAAPTDVRNLCCTLEHLRRQQQQQQEAVARLLAKGVPLEYDEVMQVGCPRVGTLFSYSVPASKV
jgi:hypothetical protein